MAGPKLRLWARLIQAGRYDDYDKPPNIPLISGSSGAVKSKDSMREAVTGAATAVVKMLQSTEKTTPTHPSTSMHASPLKAAQLRRSCLEDLKKIKELLEDGVLTNGEFREQKENILHSLKTLN